MLDIPSSFSPDTATSGLLEDGIQVRSAILDAFVARTPGVALDRLPGAELTTAGVNAALAKRAWSVVGYLCHGVTNAVLGKNVQPMMDTTVATSLVKGRIFCITACFAGDALGADLWQKQAKAVFGYDDALIFDAASLPEIVKCATVADVSALDGQSPAQIEMAVRAAYGQAIAAANQLLNVSVAQHLQHALDCFVARR